MKIRLIGFLQHLVPNRLQLFTMTEEHETGSNHIIDALHRLLKDLRRSGPLPKRPYLQFDNCSREKKNGFIFSYLESLVEIPLFDEILVGFLPVGQANEDIDQSFSVTSAWLKSTDVITLKDMNSVLRNFYNNLTVVNHIEKIETGLSCSRRNVS